MDDGNVTRLGRKPVRLLSLLLLVVSTLAVAAEERHALKVVASSSIPPYVIASQDRGIVVDLLRAALGPAGYDISMEYAPNRRAKEEFLAHRADAVYNLSCGSVQDDFLYSAPIIDYRNVVVTLEPPRVPLESLADLSKVRLVAFQNAPDYLGPEFAEAVRSSRHYDEVSDQAFQVDMLFSGHADAIVLDRRIFLYFYAHPSRGSPKRGAYRIVPLFPEQARCAAFHDSRIRDLFNTGLQALRSNGSYQQIVDRYGEQP